MALGLWYYLGSEKLYKGTDQAVRSRFCCLHIHLKKKFTLFLKCIYYRVYSMVDIIIHLMCVKSLQLACNELLSVDTGGLAICS